MPLNVLSHVTWYSVSWPNGKESDCNLQLCIICRRFAVVNQTIVTTWQTFHNYDAMQIYKSLDWTMWERALNLHAFNIYRTIISYDRENTDAQIYYVISCITWSTSTRGVCICIIWNNDALLTSSTTETRGPPPLPRPFLHRRKCSG